MAILTKPAKISKSGPWLIDAESLDELEQTIKIIEARMTSGYEKEVANELEQRLKAAKESESESMHTLESVRASFLFRENEKVFMLQGRDEEKLTDESINGLLKDSHLDYMSPKSLSALITKGQFEFGFTIASRYSGNLDVDIKGPDENVITDIKFELNKWITKYQPNAGMRFWAKRSWSDMLLFLPLMVGLAIIAYNLTSTSSLPKSTDLLQKEAQDLLRGGITNEELNKAVEIILMKEMNLVRARSEQPTTMPTSDVPYYIGAITLAAIILVLTPPKTTIGLGRNAKKVVLQKRWSNIVLVFIPTVIILPVLRSKIFG